ncbi:TRAP-type C4-dicarboxylate transport system substrate-binding protein [Spinactinospora alkalitolerans]|uniref:TRAP-type C4-dicarboxylate transport system substrate-binding protein n=2 Tax=Spinactinospora alkalitolerans TaxID=687207 RepID=A0A852TY47_9ACTN|nr:TRAP-type C4-dicarboxylate transport system substrate-binding protein [Spinactinospora alkalitolerans]
MAGVLALTGCAEGRAAGSGGSGEGVDYGATKEEYQAAFAEVAPIELHTQSPAPKGSITGRNVEEYFNAVTEWSDGKITFEVSYSNAIAPPEEADDALLDGRLDIAQVLPIYEPSEYPANAALVESSFVSDQSVVVGALQSNAWPLEVAFDTPEIPREFEDAGMKLMMPSYNSGSNALFCSDERRGLDALKGMQAAAGGHAQSRQVEGLGGAAVSVAYPELFESLQRGVVDCSVSSLTVGVLGGFIEAAPHVVVDPEAGFALAPGAMAMSQSAWDSLPLVAQQLLWDRMDVFMEVNLSGKIWPNIVEASTQVSEAGGAIETFEEDARASINETNAELLDGLRGNEAFDDPDAFADRVQGSSDAWLETIEGELGYTNETDYNGFADWYSADKVDLDPYIAEVFEEILLEHRPS